MGRALDVLMIATGLSAVAMGFVVVRDRFFAPRLPASGSAQVHLTPAEWQALGDHITWTSPAARKVQVVEFADFQCPYCASLHAPLAQIISAHGDSVAFGFGYFPLSRIHPYAFPSAVSAVCAERQGRFAPMAAALFDHQDLFGIVTFDSLARLAGVPNHAAFRRCLSDPEARMAVDTGLAWADRLSLDGTPTVYVNGTLVPVETGAAGIEAAVETALAAP